MTKYRGYYIDHVIFDSKAEIDEYLKQSAINTREFVEKLFSDYREGAGPITIEEAEADIRNFDADGWELPDNITAKEYMEIWNELVNEG